MKTNTTLLDIIQSELINHGKNEFFNDNQISIFKDKHTFIKKILRYDDDIEYIVNDKFFNDLTLDEIEHDRKFKRLFINRFLSDQPAQQTLELFSSMVSTTFLNNIDFLNMYYNNIDDFIRGKAITDAKGNESRLSDNRNAKATLPQSEVNINVDNTVLNYADDNTITRIRDKAERDDLTESYNFDIDNLEKSKNILESVLGDFEKNCFMKVY